MSEHRLSYVLDMADKLVVMNNGKIMEWGNPLEIADKIKNILERGYRHPISAIPKESLSSTIRVAFNLK